MSPEELREHRMDLPLHERAEIAYGLPASVVDDELDEDPAEVDVAWAEEIKRRVDEIRNGTAETYALEDVLAEMEERYG